MANEFKIEKIKLDSKGIRQFLKSPEVMEEIKSVAHKEGQIVKDYIGFDRAHVVVKEGKSNAD